MIFLYFLSFLRCYDHCEHADEELFPALKETNPEFKNRKVCEVGCTLPDQNFSHKTEVIG